MLDPVPWFIGGDAEHSADVARMLAYLATNGKEGVVAPDDMKVVPLDVPGPGVKVAAGGASVLNRTAPQQAYTVRNATPDVDSVKFGATGSSGGRSDLVVARVQNPYVDGNASDPDDPVHGPYVAFEVVPGVPAGTRTLQTVPNRSGDSAIALARVDIPASTQTITSSMITDLRRLANPRTERNVLPGTLPSPAQGLTLSNTAWQNFPSTGISGVEVPSWATHAVVRLETTYAQVSGNIYFNLQAFLGDQGVAANLFSDVRIDASNLSKSGGDQAREPIILPSQGPWPVPAAMRGTTQKVTSRVRAALASGNGAKITTASEDYYIVDITFMERIS
jgi:hypothetical protein